MTDLEDHVALVFSGTSPRAGCITVFNDTMSDITLKTSDGSQCGPISLALLPILHPFGDRRVIVHGFAPTQLETHNYKFWKERSWLYGRRVRGIHLMANRASDQRNTWVVEALVAAPPTMPSVCMLVMPLKVLIK